MADVKISALPLATTPLAGTEVLPIVQSATTDQVSVANLTAGRAVSAASLTLTTTPLAVGSGGTGLSTLTAGYIPYGNGTSAFSSSSAFVFDGTNLGVGSSPAYKLDVLSGSGSQNIFRAGQSGVSNGYTIVSNGSALTYRWHSAGSEAMQLDGSGSLGLGVTPSAWNSGARALQLLNGWGAIAANNGNGNFELVGNAYLDTSGNWKYYAGFAAARYTINNAAGGSHVWYNAASGSAGSAITFTQAMTLDASENLLVGTTSSSAKFTVEDSSNQPVVYARNTNATYTSEGITFRPSRNTTGGSFYAFSYYNVGAAAYKFYVIDGGNIYSTSATVNVISDIRLKENVRDLDTGLSDILKLRPRRFDWKEGQGDGSKNTPGFIAQEVEAVIPELVVPWKVTDAKDDDHKGLATGNLIPTLVKAIQELAAKVAELEAKI